MCCVDKCKVICFDRGEDFVINNKSSEMLKPMLSECPPSRPSVHSFIWNCLVQSNTSKLPCLHLLSKPYTRLKVEIDSDTRDPPTPFPSFIIITWSQNVQYQSTLN